MHRAALIFVFLCLRTLAAASDGERDAAQPAPGPAYASPRLHIQAGGNFTTDELSVPGIGGPWFGGACQAGYALMRFGKNREILVSGGFEWAAQDPAGYVAIAPDFAAGQLVFAYQSLDRQHPGLGYRVNAGVRRIFARPPDFYRERFLPVASATGIAQSSSAIYYYLDIGLLIIMPITIGVGMNL